MKTSKPSAGFVAFYYVSLALGTGSSLAWLGVSPGLTWFQCLWAFVEIALICVAWALPFIGLKVRIPPALRISLMALLFTSAVLKVALMLLFAAA